MQPFLAILAEEETASVMDSPALFAGELGVTKLNKPWQCGHFFCRRELRFVFFSLSPFRSSFTPGNPMLMILFSNSITKWLKTGVSSLSFPPWNHGPFSLLNVDNRN